MDRAFRHDLLTSPWRVLQAYPLTEEEKHLSTIRLPSSQEKSQLLDRLCVKRKDKKSDESQWRRSEEQSMHATSGLK